MIREIVKSEIFLRMPSDEAGADDSQLVLDLLDTLAEHRDECIGLAANMVGERKRIIAVVDADGRSLAMLNPQIVKQSEPYKAREACLSLRGTRPVTRYRTILVRYQDSQLAWHEESFVGLTAQAIQHEVDHCNGVVV